jgi:hypothetical protein
MEFNGATLVKTLARLSFPTFVALIVAFSFAVPDAPGFKMFSSGGSEIHLFDQTENEVKWRDFTYKALYGISQQQAKQLAEWLCANKQMLGPFRLKAGNSEEYYTPTACERKR